MSFGEQSSDNQSSQGLKGPEREYFSGMMPGLFSQAQSRANEAYADPGGLQFMDTINQLLPVGEYGLPTGATEGARQLGRDMFSKASASRSLQGRTSPYNLEGVMGDALRMASPTLLPLSTQFAFQRASMAPALRQAAFNFGVSPYEMAQRALAGSGESSGSSGGFMIDSQLGSILSPKKGGG